MKKFSGVGVALVTPFQRNGKVDEPSLRNLVEYVIEGGADYLVALGTTAESVTLSGEEREFVVNVITEHNGGRLPLVIGVGGNCTEAVLEDLRTLPYLRQGDAILSVTPYYNKPTQQGLYTHFSAIAEHAPLPVILYNVPGRTGVNMTAETVLRLAREHGNIIALKEAAGNLEQATEILRNKPEHFLLLSGDDAFSLPLISLGASGVIAVIANVLPREYADLIHAALEGELGMARRIQYRLADLYKLLFEEGNPTGIKAALYAKGIINTPLLRPPLCEAGEILFDKIAREMERFA